MLSLLIAVVTSKLYTGDKVYRINVDSDYKIQVLDNLLQNDSLNLRFWDGGARLGQSDLHVPYSSLPYTSILDRIGQVWIENVQELIDNESGANSKYSIKTSAVNATVRNTTGLVDGDFFSSYHDYSDILAFHDQLGLKKVVVGTSYLNNPIYGYYIGSGPQAFIIQGGIHAREWIAPATVSYLSQFLLSSNFTSKFTFLMVPVFNVDGYNYTRTTDRLWRKNRQPNSDGTTGTDCNRNFNIMWGQSNGASTDTNAEDYKGTAPNSTPEVSSITTYYQNLKNVVGFVDFHSYSQLWMYPYGYDCTHNAPDYKDLDAASKLAVHAIISNSTQFYEYGPICNTIYQVSGSATDWAYATLKAKYSLAIELRDTGTYGFILPPNQIVPTGNEIVSGMTAFLNYIVNDRNTTEASSSLKAIPLLVAITILNIL